MKGVRTIDLEDARYENRVQRELQTHAKKSVEALKQLKKYNSALTYYARSLLGQRAQNTQWIDIICIQLGELATTDGDDLTVREILENTPQDLNDLLIEAWEQIFDKNWTQIAKMKEMLRAMVLTNEDPTEIELAMLAGFPYNAEKRAEFNQLIRQCRPLSIMKRSNRDGPIIAFRNIVIKTHLCDNAEVLPGLSNAGLRRQHGVLTHRCVDHLKGCYGVVAQAKEKQDDDEGYVMLKKGTHDCFL